MKEAFDIKKLKIGRFFGPCSGNDLPFAFQLVGGQVDRFTFCDLSYGRDKTAGNAVPGDWTLISRVSGREETQQSKRSWYTSRLIRPSATIEVWRRADGSEVIVELRNDLAQDVLLQQFASASISVFMHINDGSAEGGSNLQFLRSSSQSEPDQEQRRGEFMFSATADRLVDGALVLTDGVLADREFSLRKNFERAGFKWEWAGDLDKEGRRDRTVMLWRACLLK